MDLPPTHPAPAAHRDRSGGLVVFGALTILLGALSALLVPLMFFGQMMAPPGTNPGGMRSLIPASLMYLGLAVILVWLGIGSIQARRWARALLVILFGSWLAVGVISVIATAVLMPSLISSIQAMQPGGQPLPPSAVPVMMVIPLLVLGLMFVIVPGIGVWFYSSANVRATCDAQDQTPSWTDACPLPLLAVALWAALMSPMLFLLPLTQEPILPIFGAILTDGSATIGFFVIALIWAWSAWAIYRRDARGWWVLVTSLAIFTISNIILYSRHDLIEIFEMMKYPPEQLDLLRRMPLMNSRWAVWGMAILAFPMFGYLFYVKRFLRKSG